jgi:hypothetical protein
MLLFPPLTKGGRGDFRLAERRSKSSHSTKLHKPQQVAGYQSPFFTQRVQEPLRGKVGGECGTSHLPASVRLESFDPVRPELVEGMNGAQDMLVEPPATQLSIRHGEVLTQKSIRPFVVSLSNHLRCRTNPSTSSGRTDFKHNLIDSIEPFDKAFSPERSRRVRANGIVFKRGAS